MRCRSIWMLLVMVMLVTPLHAHNERDENSTDIPTWYVGDTWVYDMDIYYSSENGSFDGTIYNFTTTVVNVTVMDGYDVYAVNMTGIVDGFVSYSLFSGDVDGIMYGDMFVRRSDMSTTLIRMTSVGVIHGLIFDHDYTSDITVMFDPPAEMFDFPIYTNESWDYYYHAQVTGYIEVEDITNETINSTEEGCGEISCTGLETISVPAGTFETFHMVDTNNTYESWYSPAAENVVKSVVSNSDGNTTYDIYLNMTSYSLVEPPINLSMDINPYEAIAGENVTVSGFAHFSSAKGPVANTSVVITMPLLNISWTAFTDENGYYCTDIEVPFFNDGTQSPTEVASDGIISSIAAGNVSGYKVKTLVVKGVSFNVSLAHGWNLITVPLGNNYTASSLAALIDDCSMIAWWNAATDTYTTFIVGVTPPGSPWDFAINDGIGYYVKVTDDSSLALSGIPITTANVALYSGWNTIGWWKMTATTASSLGGNITNCTQLAMYDAASGSYTTFLVGITPPDSPWDFPVTWGMGLFAKVTSGSVWHGEG